MRLQQSALAAAFVIALLGSLPCEANEIRYTVIRDGTTPVSACDAFEGGSSYSVSILLDLTTNAKSLTFSGPQGPGLSSVTWNFPVSGDPATSQTLDLGGCQTGTVLLGTAVYNMTSDSCVWLIRGPMGVPNELSPPVLTQCDDVQLFLPGQCTAAGPTLLTPANGATDVPLTPGFTWQWEAGEFCIEGIGVQSFDVWLGTSPGNMQPVDFVSNTNTWSPALPLQESTTYYWRLLTLDDFWNYNGSNRAFSNTHSFTTTATVGVEHHNWSHVKRVYRD